MIPLKLVFRVYTTQRAHLLSWLGWKLERCCLQKNFASVFLRFSGGGGGGGGFFLGGGG
jgi:hypothetical protein